MKRVLLTAALLSVATAAGAQSSQSSMSTTFTTVVEAACEVVSASSIQFGAYDPVNINRTLSARSEGNISVRCTNGTKNVRIALSQGQNATPQSNCEVPARRMRSSRNEYLLYQIFQDSNRALVWGCDVNTSKELPTFTSLSSVNVSTYGLVFQGQDVQMGSYTDTVEVFVTF